MRRVTSVMPHGTWDPSEAESLAVAELTHEERYRRRAVLNDTKGEFLLDLERPVPLRDGDGLLLHDGGIILVRAAVEPVADVTAPAPADIARIAWHLGNRHAPVEVLDDGGLRFQDDGVLSKMVEGLGGAVTRHKAPFSPEQGAYAGRPHEHGHGHAH